ncbi:DUF6527 family protein [Rhizobium pusense]|uniref:DUF6527 family protein n=1 Tax=Hyphomicrobiales TaxID=356 RepID=UPI00244ABDA5|nr:MULTISPECIES: DUF6527 family protein [Hyphomicrobiales]MDH2089938.1 DUF6527 family protein [Agrobacterium pusense]MDR6828465.1 hypothetical protein [Bosea robiniae]MDR6895124.1 hypothetical protein [Bosea sp. BE109]MDR7138310.1 hypothetical protein [Bosea sp. BE168]MDR7175009.1 hypothetical protein [Bosea sp. BE271]
MTEPARMVRLVGDAEYRDQAEASLSTPGDASMVFRSRPRSIVMACPDGCGETLVINLDSRADKAWRFDMRGEGLTLFPSVWREGGCESHFIVWRGHILWCDRFEGANREPPYNPEIEAAVLSAMDEVQPRNAVELADAIEELVWDVSRVANRLVGRGLARSWKINGGWVFVRVV